MTKEELKQEAEKFAKTEMSHPNEYGMYYCTFLKVAEPREKRIAELEKENADLKEEINKIAFARGNLEEENAELRKVAEFQQSSNMNRYFENKKLKEGLAVGSTFNKALNSINKNLEEERDKYRNMVFDKDDQLTKAKEIIREFMKYEINEYDGSLEIHFEELKKQAEQFLSEVEK